MYCGCLFVLGLLFLAVGVVLSRPIHEKKKKNDDSDALYLSERIRGGSDDRNGGNAVANRDAEDTAPRHRGVAWIFLNNSSSDRVPERGGQ